MVLSHGNSGKILSKRMSIRRLEYLEDPEGFSDSEKDFLDASTAKNAGVALEENWLIETTPQEWLESAGPVLVDLRKIDPLKGEGRN
jgi:hypothetical protein